jgi:uncharacterized protein YbjT (DUF2867 family)
MILVLGATGTVGRRVVAQLRAAGEPVRAVSRHPSVAPPGGVEVVVADLADPASLTPHLRDVRAVFLVWPFASTELTARLAPEVIQVLAAPPRRIVYLSAEPAADDPGSFWAIVEQHIGTRASRGPSCVPRGSPRPPCCGRRRSAPVTWCGGRMARLPGR